MLSLTVIGQYWQIILGIAAAIGAVTKFWQDALKIKELNLKIQELRASIAERASPIQRATPEDIERYGSARFHSHYVAVPFAGIILTTGIVGFAFLGSDLESKHKTELAQVQQEQEQLTARISDYEDALIQFQSELVKLSEIAYRAQSDPINVGHYAELTRELSELMGKVVERNKSFFPDRSDMIILNSPFVPRDFQSTD